MSRFRFGEIVVEVHREGPDPLHLDSDYYKARISHDDVFLESMLKKPRGPRTAGSDFSIASDFLASMFVTAMNPEGWAEEMQADGKMSQEEIDAVTQVAANLEPYMEEAMRATRGRIEMYQEHFESGIGPLELGISRKLEFPDHIGNKEEIAKFFAYLYVVDQTSFHPDEDFNTYVDVAGRPSYTTAEAESRNILMVEAIQAAEAEGLDIYEVALWVGALTGASDDPENEAQAPAWLKALSNTWV